MNSQDKKLLTAFAKVLEESQIYDLQEFVNELYRLYRDFSDKSNRVLRALRGFMPDSKARLLLTNFILDTLVEYGPMSIKDLQSKVFESFEYQVTPKSVYNSVYYLVQNKRIRRVYDAKRRRRMLTINE